MFPSLNAEQRQAIASEGTPLLTLDAESGEPYLLMSVRLSGLPNGFVSAAVPELGLRGDGAAPDEALIALSVVAKGLYQS